MKIVVLAVGKLRDRHVAALCDDYVARARRHLTVDVVEVEDDAALRASGRRRARRSRSRSAARAGRPSGSPRHLGDRMLHGGRAITFAIGGADGLPRRAGGARDPALSLSALTLPHRLARLVLLEQIYRALTIIRGEPYHH